MPAHAVAQNMLVEIEQHQALSEKHSAKARTLLAQYRSIVANGYVNSASETQPVPLRPIKSLTRWVNWLKANGPALRKTLVDAVGPLGGNAVAYTLDWDWSMGFAEDDAFIDDTMLKMTIAPETGKGRPPDVYFLWSQRYDLLDLFGVGPSHPELEATKPEPTDPEPLTGVIRPVPEFEWTDAETWPNLTWDDVEPEWSTPTEGDQSNEP